MEKTRQTALLMAEVVAAASYPNTLQQSDFWKPEQRQRRTPLQQESLKREADEKRQRRQARNLRNLNR